MAVIEQRIISPVYETLDPKGSGEMVSAVNYVETYTGDHAITTEVGGRVVKKYPIFEVGKTYYEE